MENLGLGTLAKLPREIRDMIFDLLFSDNDCPCTGRLVFNTIMPTHDLICKRRVAVLASVKEVKRVFGSRLPLTLRTKCSRQFYREVLESYLRNINILFAGRTQTIPAIIQILGCLNKIVDIASHTRKFSIGCFLSIDNEKTLSQQKQEFLIDFAEILKTLKCCERLFGILARKLGIAVSFGGIALPECRRLPVARFASTNRELGKAQTYLRACLDVPIEIVVGDRLQSVQNMERWCGVIEQLMYKCLTLAYEERSDTDNHLLNDLLEKEVRKARLIVKHTLSGVKELQLVFIDVAIQYWEDEDEEELENVCRRLRWKAIHGGND